MSASGAVEVNCRRMSALVNVPEPTRAIADTAAKPCDFALHAGARINH
jgi:hypothetical protein